MGNAVACSKPPALETCSDSIWYFISFNAGNLQYKGVCHDSLTDAWMRPCRSTQVTFLGQSYEPAELNIALRKRTWIHGQSAGFF